ncbi:unnamed protein product, partial [Ectocarpus fasciculatus]
PDYSSTRRDETKVACPASSKPHHPSRGNALSGTYYTLPLSGKKKHARIFKPHRDWRIFIGQPVSAVDANTEDTHTHTHNARTHQNTTRPPTRHLSLPRDTTYRGRDGRVGPGE